MMCLRITAAGWGGKRKIGARKPGGSAAPAAGVLWSAWDLKVGIGT